MTTDERTGLRRFFDRLTARIEAFPQEAPRLRRLHTFDARRRAGQPGSPG